MTTDGSPQMLHSQMMQDLHNASYPPTPAGFSLPGIAARLFDTPLLLAPAKVNAIAWALRDRLGLQGLSEPTGDVMQAVGPGLMGSGEWDREKGYYVSGSVAVIPVSGTLVNRAGFMDAFSGMTSYESLSNKVDRARNDSRVQAVMLDINSYGGEASGVDDLAQEIRALDAEKPVYSMIDGHGTSAAYWIASAARQVYIANSSHGGSIGVVLTHMDYSGAAEQAGITVTHIHAGAEKVLGTPWRSLSDEDKSKLQARVDALYSAFVKTVADHRGISTEDVRKTEAGMFDGPEMVARGLADGITTGRRLLAAIQANHFNPATDEVADSHSGTRRANAQNGGSSMSETTRKGGAETAAEPTYTKAEVDQLLATANADQDAAVSAGVSAERQRIQSILGCEAAAARPKLARTLAFSAKGYSVEDATELLQASAEEQAEASATQLDQLMQSRTPGISSDAGTDPETDPAIAAANFVLSVR